MTLIEKIFKNYVKGSKQPLNTVEVVSESPKYPKITGYAELDDILDTCDVIGITGYPGSGKTSLSKYIKDREVIHTDAFLNNPHEKIPEILLNYMKHSNKYCIEGTQVTRLLSRGWEPDVLILVYGSERTDTKGINKMIDNDLADYKGKVVCFNPRELSE